MKSKVRIKVVGNNLNRFLMRLYKKNINIYEVKKNSKYEYLIVIDYDNYDLVLKNKTIYDVEIIEYLGFKKIKKKIIKNWILYILIVAALIFVMFLSKLTFKIDIITNDDKIKNLLLQELKEQGIYKYSLGKSYDEINKIKGNILKKYNNILEWLEIKRVGTRYIIRFEQRLTSDRINDDKIYNIVAKKDARIIDLDIESGQIIKNINEYVKKDELIVSSDILLNSEVKNIVTAKGNIYGEVWYNVNVKYPKNYSKMKKTGKRLITYSFNFFNKKIMFKKDNFFDKINTSDKIIGNLVLPLSFNKETIEEVKIASKASVDEAINLGLEKIKDSLEENEEILYYKVLKKHENDDLIEVDLFVSVKESIGKYILK